MSGSAIGLSLNYGYAGVPSHTPDLIITAKQVNDASAEVPFGHAVILNADNTITKAGATATATNFMGIAGGLVKQMTTYPTSTEDSGGVFAAGSMAGVIERGLVPVKVTWGDAPAAPGDVYLRTVANGSYPDSPVGSLGFAADGGNAVKLTNCSWDTGIKDANDIAILKIKSINI